MVIWLYGYAVMRLHGYRVMRLTVNVKDIPVVI